MLISVRGIILFFIDNVIIYVLEGFIKLIWLIYKTDFTEIYAVFFHSVVYIISNIKILFSLFLLNTHNLIMLGSTEIYSFKIQETWCLILLILIVNELILILLLICSVLNVANVRLRSWILALILIKLI